MHPTKHPTSLSANVEEDYDLTYVGSGSVLFCSGPSLLFCL